MAREFEVGQEVTVLNYWPNGQPTGTVSQRQILQCMGSLIESTCLICGGSRWDERKAVFPTRELAEARLRL